MYRYNLAMEKESKTLNTYLLYVKVFITSVPNLIRPESETDVTETESAVMKDSVLQVKMSFV